MFMTLFIALLLLISMLLVATLLTCDQVVLGMLRLMGDRSQQQQSAVLSPLKALAIFGGFVVFALWFVATIAC